VGIGFGRGLRRWLVQQGALNAFDGLLQIERLGQVIERATLNRAHRRRQIAERCHDDDRQIGHKLTEAPQRRQAVHAGQANVEDQNIGPPLVQECEGLLGGCGRRNGMSFSFQSALERPAHGFFIIDN